MSILARVSIVAAVLMAAPAAAAPECVEPEDITKLAEPLLRTSNRIARGEPVTVLAIGSSSTAGFGASRTELNYPSRLEASLRRSLATDRIRVVNRGVNGVDAREMVAGLDRGFGDLRPDLILWQVGTNALLRDRGVDSQAPLIRDGLKRMLASGADVILIDPQYAPKVLMDADAVPMVNLLARVAAESRVSVFRRFELMRFWNQTRAIAFEDILSPDLFHMNDWSYGCFAETFARAIVAKVRPAPAAPVPTLVRNSAAAATPAAR